jgi:hypothetical protein
MSRSKDGVLKMLRSNEDVLGCLSNEERLELVCRSNEFRLPCLTNISRVGLRVREGGGPFIVLVFLRPNSSSETPPPRLPSVVDWELTAGTESLLLLVQGEKNL